MEEDKSFSEPISHSDDSNHGWQKVTAKRQRKNQNNKAAADSSKLPNGSAIAPDKNSVFKGLEKHAEDRRRKLEAQRAAAVYDDSDDNERSRNNHRRGEEDDDLSSDADVKSNAVEVKKKEKQKKAKKPKVTVAEAAAKIDADDLVAFLSSVSESYKGQQDIQLMRFADYFGRAFSAVSASQFPWLKLFRESPVAKIANVPVSYISEAVYKASVDWINQRSYDALGTFVVWSLDGILADLAAQQSGNKVSKKGVNATSSKSQVAIFLVLGMVLCRKPDVLINLLPTLRENSKYQGQDKLPVLIWMTVQASQIDISVGLYLWSHLILPILGGKSGSNPHTRDLVLQLVERIVAVPKARSILVNNAVRKGERLMPPVALDLLLRVTFPAPHARVKATERFEAVYPLLKDVALAGSPGSKAMKQVSLQIQSLIVKTAGEGVPALSEEASSIFIWCLRQNPDCFKQWEKIYDDDNIEASVAALRKLSENWKEFSSKQSSLQVRDTLKSFMQKNEKALNGEADAKRQTSFKDADKYCKIVSGKLSSGHGCVKAMFFTLAVLAVGAAVVFPNTDEWDFNKLLADAQKSF
ncbi:transmembrane protein 214-A-like [Salvia splendens]|uniref:transmembrane protein 214-A-like n=1 Tax=Salvia splendens TaxID=180675 RepID=UPI001C26EBEF|nr:transmembrane protein 214-A-like [Salvia splendens]